MMKGLGFDESMSNLTSTISAETSISSNARNEQSSSTTTANNTNTSATATATANATMLYPQASSSSFASPHQLQPPQPPPAKKKRGLPGNPDPDAEVIALSPKSLLATSRFFCEICNKGFQRDQNLQLHRRGHNLPWKLKQRAKDQIVRKKVYICPEPSCVHHDPSRALGDLTGIKKHFCRKHGEKKWKCEKCSKKYAVQSDWKAHSKICGTREYRCDCGTLFSRRDSFITHRAFCDALAQESTRAINPLSTLPSSISYQTNTSNALSHLTLPSHLTSQHHILHSLPLKQEHPDHHHLLHQHHRSPSSFFNVRSDVPPWLACPPPPQPPMVLDGGAQHQLNNQPSSHHLYTTFQQSSGDNNSNSNSNATMEPTLSTFQAPMNPQMSATALLQKAAEMGVTVSNTAQQSNHQPPPWPPSDGGGTGGGESSFLHDVMLMSSFQPTPPSVSGGFGSPDFGDFHHQAQHNGGSGGGGASGGGGGGNDGLTRDFLGLRSFSHKDFLNMAGLGGHHMNSSSTSFEQQHDNHQNQNLW